jgi:hypothetical protein
VAGCRAQGLWLGADLTRPAHLCPLKAKAESDLSSIAGDLSLNADWPMIRISMINDGCGSSGVTLSGRLRVVRDSVSASPVSVRV